MRFELGINNCFAVKRWPEPDEWAAVVATELDLAVVQHSLDLSLAQESWESDAERIRQACDTAGVRVDSVFTGLSAYSSNLMLGPSEPGREQGFHFWAAGIGFAARIGASSFGGHVGSLSRADADDDRRAQARWEELRERLRRLARLANRHELAALLVENMACDREPWQMADVRSLLSPAAPGQAAVSLCLDVGHQCAPGAAGEDADPYAWLRSMGSRTRVVHLQQSDAEGDHHWPFTAAFNAQGRIRADRVIESLIESGAEEMTLILEVIPSFEAPDAQVLRDLRESVSYWKRALADFAIAGANPR
jgi:D-erythrulose 1-phosphate 3-epimerase